MILSKNTHQQVVSALSALQERGESINNLADDLSVTRSWLHKLKRDGSGQKTWENIIKVAAWVWANHPELMTTTIKPTDESNKSGSGSAQQCGENAVGSCSFCSTESGKDEMKRFDTAHEPRELRRFVARDCEQVETGGVV